ncbi:tryptophan--tRNA ligase [Candidatus Pacearchaeota archaeon]|nr:tryptophan--tRNA ligase [Candidatus Pacearchaeota archaeon]
MKKESRKFTVTPWKIEGNIQEEDYAKLTKEFGTEPLTNELLERIKKHTGELHYLLRRKIFFSHRDLKWLLDEYEKGNKFFLYTGRGPSGNVHLGHLLPWILTKWLQDKFKAKLYFQMTDDEKFLVSQKLSLEETRNYAYENALDVIALGFKPELTKIIIDTENIKKLYPIALKVAKKLTFSTVKAVFGFDNATNVGMNFFTSIQSAPCFIENKPCLIPLGIDQDPHFRITRDIAPKLGFMKPALLHCKFAPGLGESGKMSASQPETAIFTTDSEKDVEFKIRNAFTGGRETIAKQKQLGGMPEKCTIYHYLLYFFEPDDKAMQEKFHACRMGQTYCGECKVKLAETINKFLREHQKKRELAKKQLGKFLMKD